MLLKMQQNKNVLSKVNAFLRSENNIVFLDVALQIKNGIKTMTIRLSFTYPIFLNRDHILT